MADHTEAHTIDEVEVTEAMVEAGVREFLSYDSRFEEPRDAVMNIYQAMFRKTAKG